MTVHSTDVLIIGSGPVGSTFARAILDRCPTASVLLVEAGPKLTEPPGINVGNLTGQARLRAQTQSRGPYRSFAVMASGRSGNSAHPALFPVGGPDLPAAALTSCVGGMGAHWNCATPRPHGSERIPFLDAAEWEWAITTAERLLGTTPDLFADSVGGKAIRSVLGTLFAPLLPAGRGVGILPVAARPRADGGVHWAGTDTILATSWNVHSGLRLCAETVCQKLTWQGDRVTGAVLRHLRSGSIREVSASVVVVAADPLRTPQLLWASGIRPAALGRYLNEHPMISAAVELDANIIPPLTDAEQAQEFVSVSTVPFAEPHHPLHGQIVQTSGPEAGRATLTWFGRKTPTAQDRVTFSTDRTDWCGLPEPRLHYQLTDGERAELARGRELVANAAHALGRYLPAGRARVLPTGSSLHYQGTVRMGAVDDDTSVCDSYSRVWQFANLFVGGNGVIPTVTACNPTLTSVALAVRAAGAIIDLLGRSG